MVKEKYDRIGWETGRHGENKEKENGRRTEKRSASHIPVSSGVLSKGSSIHETPFLNYQQHVMASQRSITLNQVCLLRNSCGVSLL